MPFFISAVLPQLATNTIILLCSSKHNDVVLCFEMTLQGVTHILPWVIFLVFNAFQMQVLVLRAICAPPFCDEGTPNSLACDRRIPWILHCARRHTASTQAGHHLDLRQLATMLLFNYVEQLKIQLEKVTEREKKIGDTSRCLESC